MCETEILIRYIELKSESKPEYYGADPNGWARDVRGSGGPVYLHLSQQQGPTECPS